LKKSIIKSLGLLALCAAMFTSCTSVKEISSYTNEIQSEKIGINTYFDKSDYSIIGTAAGESEFVWWNSSESVYEGDSGKYGFISEPTTINVGENVIVGTGRKNISSLGEEEIVRRAKLNANYALIEKAYAMGGDYILEPIYSVEIEASNASGSEVRKARVQVRAKVIQLKTK